MILAVGVDVLDVDHVIDQRRQRAVKVLAGAERVEHRAAICIECQPPMDLLLAWDALVIALGPENALGLHHVCDGLAPAAIPDGRISHAHDRVALQLRILILNQLDLLGLLDRVPAVALVRRAVGTV